MSPQSEPYIFREQTGVPLFSGTFYHDFYITGLAWGIVFQLIQLMTRFVFEILQWLLITLFTGLMLQLLYAMLKKRRFYNPVTNQDLIEMFEQVTQDLGKGQRTELWLRDIDRGVFLSTVNPFYKAILFSENTIADILEKREKGKVILAKEVLMIETLRPLSRTAIGLLGFTFISLVESLTFFESMEYIMFSMGLIIPIIILVTLLLFIVAVPFTTNRSEKKIVQILEEIYGVPPDAAMIEVLTGFELPDESIEDAKREGEAERQRRKGESLKKGLVGALTAFLISFIIIYLLYSSSPMWVFSLVIIPLALGIGAFAIVYVTSLVWDFIKPGGARNTQWDIQVPFATDVQNYLHKYLGSKEVAVRAVKPPAHEKYGLVVLKLNDNYDEDTIFAMLPQVLEDIHDAELAGSFILSEIWRKAIERRYNRISYVIVGAVIIFLAGGMIYVFTGGFARFFGLFAPIFITYLIMAFVPLTILSLWKRNAEILSDTRVARECRRFTEALQNLISHHHTLPYGMTSYQSRLERIEKRLGTHENEDTGGLE
ncbi:MAG: hypothetical protein ACFFE2_10535 [Candidatus Thorarchaeota archaeon]